jgi:transcriptional regulator with XRE-family HTH domain
MGLRPLRLARALGLAGLATVSATCQAHNVHHAHTAVKRDSRAEAVYCCAMSTPGERLRRAREAAGYATAAEGAERAGVKYYTYAQHENGIRGIPADKAARYAAAFGVEPQWILYGGSGSGRRLIPVVGYVGASTEFFGFDDHALGAGLDQIEAPPGAPDHAVAVIVRGDSGYPAIRDGMVLVYWEKYENPADLVGEDCFVRLKDGRTLVKILERGASEGLWTLASINSSTPPIRNVEIEWAAPIEVRLRRANWGGPS